MTGRNFLVAGIAAALTFCCTARNCPRVLAADNAEIDAAEVRQSIEKGVAYLKAQQHPKEGNWPDIRPGQQVGGITCICTLALINCGTPVSDPSIQKALAYLRTLTPDSTYVMSLQTMVFCIAEPQRDLLKIQTSAKWLEDHQIKDTDRRGSWSYPRGEGDMSNSQFALLALSEAEHVGITVSDETWRLALRYWKGSQNTTGSWGYFKGTETGSMTCAGIASLVIASGRTSAGDARVENGIVSCCGNQDADDSADRIERALKWLGRKDIFSVERNPQVIDVRRLDWHFYFLYGLERIGRMTNRRFIGDHDWYREGAAFLCSPNVQNLNGSWQADLNTNPIESDANLATSFALLFLGKGRRPIVMSKAQHGPEGDWNHHRNDVANLTMYAETKWKAEYPLGLSWQVVDLSKATVDDLLQSPVLYINGSQSPAIDDRQGQVLKDYVDRGGFILAEACCAGSAEFDRGFRDLMKRVFPPEYQLRLLPPEHPIWRAEEIVPADKQRTVLGIDYGCRTSVVYFPPGGPNDPPNSLSCYLEMATWRKHDYPKHVAEQVAAARAIGINVLAYATNRDLKDKTENFHAKESRLKDTYDRGKLYIAKLKHPGGCDTAPAALPHLLEAAARELQVRVETEQRLVDITDPALLKYHMVMMHGRRSFSLTREERDALRKYIKQGGTLLADSICANREFTESFRREMQSIFAGDKDVDSKDKPLQPIPAKHPLFSKEFGFDLSTVSLREPQAGGDTGRASASIRKIEPELEGVKIGDRYGVIFSKFDLSCALEKHDSLECEGYTRDDAERIGLNVLLYSLNQ